MYGEINRSLVLSRDEESTERRVSGRSVGWSGGLKTWTRVRSDGWLFIYVDR